MIIIMIIIMITIMITIGCHDDNYDDNYFSGNKHPARFSTLSSSTSLPMNWNGRLVIIIQINQTQSTKHQKDQSPNRSDNHGILLIDVYQIIRRVLVIDPFDLI